MKRSRVILIVLVMGSEGLYWATHREQARAVARWTYVTLWTHAPGSKDLPVPPRFLP
jgi:hypothetical protein